MKCCAYLGSMGLMHSLDVGRTTPSSFKVQYASTVNEGEIWVLSACDLSLLHVMNRGDIFQQKVFAAASSTTGDRKRRSSALVCTNTR